MPVGPVFVCLLRVFLWMPRICAASPMLYLAVGETFGSSFTISVNPNLDGLVLQGRSLLDDLLVYVLNVDPEHGTILVAKREHETAVKHDVHEQDLASFVGGVGFLIIVIPPP